MSDDYIERTCKNCEECNGGPCTCDIVVGSLADDPAAVTRAAEQIYLDANASDGEVAWEDSTYQDAGRGAAIRVLRAAETGDAMPFGYIGMQKTGEQ